ncbi:MAG: transketolase [Flavobacteriaceae bacterium]|jgi:pyruvate/2-oxoglutarate/acetoin dehydrogenase E1 component/TPP-dependent pyruvate/acetoin dehydrogenase alpha subunit|nr:transketolase [Flavobacteriaceae bacterium]
MSKKDLSFEDFKAEVLNDYAVAVTSRECSLLGRREVLTGKAKFGIFGDGKEIPQLAWAKAFQKGDWRSGYYRDQTFMMALDLLSIEDFFAGLYAHTSLEHEPMSGGRQMGGHFATHSLDDQGNFKALKDQYNSSSDISPTAGQMPRLLGLAQASSVYRSLDNLGHLSHLSDSGNEVAWGSIGNASTSEGLFWETVNAGGVMQVPMVISVWDDEYGISVHAKYQTTKENISSILSGFQREKKLNGYEIIKVNGWDYPALVAAYHKAAELARNEHVPVLIHVQELTQPQGHSTSGSHERYKGPERLQWEREHDCNLKMRQWILEQNFATDEELIDLETDIKKKVRQGKNKAWQAYLQPHLQERDTLLTLATPLAQRSTDEQAYTTLITNLKSNREPLRRDIISTSRQIQWLLKQDNSPEKTALNKWHKHYVAQVDPLYSEHLYSEQPNKAINIKAIAPEYDDNAELTDGRVVLRENFKEIFQNHPEVLIFGEDSGKIGDVNQGLEGMQEAFGAVRVSDTGIREATILGQGIGMAMRGLRPIAEIQYLDYVLYCLQTMSDDLATLRYRSCGKQKAPLIVRTRGHRLEGIWHSGSPMGGLIHLLRGMYILVPRNMTQAAGFYNTLLQSDEPALVIESLNGYRLKEKLPTNLGTYRTPIGVVETLKPGKDLTVVSYGSTLRIVEEAALKLEENTGISAEVIDVQSLLPLDINQDIVKSVARTNRLLIVDEDVPGGASAYILEEILVRQNAYQHLDSAPNVLTAKAHRPAYGTDGDYFSKPSFEDIYERMYAIMHEANPKLYPSLI